MDKRALRRIPIEPAAPDLVERAIQLPDGKERQWIVTAKKDQEQNVLVLDLFDAGGIRKGKTKPKYRMFLADDDYITLDTESSKARWLTGKLTNTLNLCYWWGTMPLLELFGSESQEAFDEWKKSIDPETDSKDTDWHGWIDRWQNQILERRLDERHSKELRHVDEMMEMIPELPPDFEAWIKNTVLEPFQYLIYEPPGKKKETAGYCTCCENFVTIDVTKQKPRRDEDGICPACGEKVCFKPPSGRLTYSSRGEKDRRWTCIFQKIPNGFVARYFCVFVDFRPHTPFLGNVTAHSRQSRFYEYCRLFYTEKDGVKRYESFEWAQYKQRGKSRWCPDAGKIDCGAALVYTKNLPEAFAGTDYKYCALQIYQQKAGNRELPVWHFIKHYPKYQIMEYLIKMGLIRIVDNICSSSYVFDVGLQLDGKTPEEIFGMSKRYIKILTRTLGTTAHLRILQKCCMDNVSPESETVDRFVERFGGNDELAGVLNAHMKLDKFIRYIDRQAGMRKLPTYEGCRRFGEPRLKKKDRRKRLCKDLARDWIDYIGWCAQLNYDLDDPYYLLPPELKQAHDRVHQEYEAKQEKLAKQKAAELDRKVRTLMTKMAGMDALHMKAGGLMIVLPENAEQIKREGTLLHHCVGTYVERVAKGETTILFVRKVDRPEEPFYTMEYKDGEVVQCRGYRNKSMTAEVQAFVNAFEKLMQRPEQKRIQVMAYAG